MDNQEPYYDPEEMESFFARHVPRPPPNEGFAFKLGDSNISAFMRMVAKVAHAFAVGETRGQKFTPLLPKLILGQADSFSDLIGCHDKPPLDEASVFDLRLGRFAGDKEYLVAGFRLWPSTNAPHYVAVVGSINQS